MNAKSMREATGSWFPNGQRWHFQGVYPFRSGKNTIRLESHPLMSHIDKLLIFKPVAIHQIPASFDSWVMEGSGISAKGLDGNLVSVFSSNGLEGHRRRIGLLSFQLPEQVRSSVFRDAWLGLAVDGSKSELATGPVDS